MSFGIVVVALIALLIFSSVKVLNEYERGVAFTLGRFTGIKGPGLILLWPLIQRMLEHRDDEENNWPVGQPIGRR